MLGLGPFIKQKPFNGFSGFGGGASGLNAAGVLGPSTVDYLVIAGGGGGGRGRGGGGGGGGYRTNYASETPGGPGTSTEAEFEIDRETNYPVIIGAGAVAGPTSDKRGGRGGDSKWATITSYGGGAGGAAFQSVSRTTIPGTYEGGSGGGGAGQGPWYSPGVNTGQGGAAVSPSSSPPQPVQGYSGGDAIEPAAPQPDFGNDGTGGGGAGAVGVPGQGGAGGAGNPSSITGSAVFRAGGGGGGGDDAAGAGGNGGGGAGSLSGGATSGTHGTGGGGGGSIWSGAGGNGGTGVIILRYENSLTIANPGGGLTLSTGTDGGYKVTTITHPSPTATCPISDPSTGNAAGNISWT